MKSVIAHSDGKVGSIKTTCDNLNWEERADGSSSPAELFLNCSPYIPRLFTIPHTLLDSSKKKTLRKKSRKDELTYRKKGLKKPDKF